MSLKSQTLLWGGWSRVLCVLSPPGLLAPLTPTPNTFLSDAKPAIRTAPPPNARPASATPFFPSSSDPPAGAPPPLALQLATRPRALFLLRPSTEPGGGKQALCLKGQAESSCLFRKNTLIPSAFRGLRISDFLRGAKVNASTIFGNRSMHFLCGSSRRWFEVLATDLPLKFW